MWLHEGTESLSHHGFSLVVHGWLERLGSNQSGVRKHPEDSLQKHWASFHRRRGLREGLSLSSAPVYLKRDVWWPCSPLAAS